MNFQQNGDIFCVLLLEVQQSQFGTSNTEIEGAREMKSSLLHVLLLYFFYLLSTRGSSHLLGLNLHCLRKLRKTLLSRGVDTERPVF